MTHGEYQVEIVSVQVWDVLNDNLDVLIAFADGKRFCATFFTLKNIESLFEKNRKTGECSGGLYLWASNMILVEALTMDVIEKTVEDLLGNGEFYSVFSRLSNRQW